MKQGKSKREMDGAMKYVKPMLIGMVIGTVVITAVLMVLSLVLSLKDVPQMLITPMVLAALGAGSFAGGLTVARLMREKGLLMGLLCGLLLFLLLWLFGLHVNEGAFGLLAAVKLGVALVFSALGGVIGVNAKKRRK